MGTTSGPLPSLLPSAEQLRELGKSLTRHRHLLGWSQEHVATAAGIDPNTYSKAERGVRKLSLSVLLRLAEVLKLTHAQAVEMVKIVGYDASVIGSTPFDSTSYPLVVGSVQEKLTGARGLWPVWAANLDGNIVAGNALALMLWHAVHSDGTLAPERFLDANVWEIIARHTGRILAPQKTSDFFFTILYVWNKLKHNMPQHIIKTFEQAIAANPILSHLLQYQTAGVEQEWQFDLSIYPDIPVPSYNDDPIPLLFQITVERIFDGHANHTGYLYTARPLRRFTDDWIRKKYSAFTSNNPPEEFVQGEWDTNNTEAALKYPTFYPAANHDLLWIITLANSEFQLLYGSDPTGEHYFDMLLSRRFLALIQPDDDVNAAFDRVKDKLLIPVRAFIQSTKVFEHTDHPRYEEMIKLKTRLSQLDRFQLLVDEALRVQPQSAVQPNGETPCFTITMPCPLTGYFLLSFAVVARRPTKTETDYRVCFVPTTIATKAALILMRLQDSKEVMQYAAGGEQEQYLWLLAILQTVREGFSKKKGDAWWYPETQFQEFYHTLEMGAFELAALKTQVGMTLLQLLVGGEEWQHDTFDLDWSVSSGEYRDGMLDMLWILTKPFKHAKALLPS